MAPYKEGWTVLDTKESKSRPGTFYQIRKGGDGKVYCSCPAWRFSKGHVCRHLKERREAGQMEPVASPQDVIVGRVVKSQSVKGGFTVAPRRVI